MESGSVQMEHLFHLRPPLAGFSRLKRILKRFHDGPPLLRLLVSGHAGPVAGEIAPVIFEVAEKQIVLEVDGVVADVAVLDFFEYLRPDRRVILAVCFSAAGLESNDHSKTFHSDPPERLSWNAAITV